MDLAFDPVAFALASAVNLVGTPIERFAKSIIKEKLNHEALLALPQVLPVIRISDGFEDRIKLYKKYDALDHVRPARLWVGQVLTETAHDFIDEDSWKPVLGIVNIIASRIGPILIAKRLQNVSKEFPRMERALQVSQTISTIEALIIPAFQNDLSARSDEIIHQLLVKFPEVPLQNPDPEEILHNVFRTCDIISNHSGPDALRFSLDFSSAVLVTLILEVMCSRLVILHDQSKPLPTIEPSWIRSSNRSPIFISLDDNFYTVIPFAGESDLSITDSQLYRLSHSVRIEYSPLVRAFAVQLGPKPEPEDVRAVYALMRLTLEHDGTTLGARLWHTCEALEKDVAWFEGTALQVCAEADIPFEHLPHKLLNQFRDGLLEELRHLTTQSKPKQHLPSLNRRLRDSLATSGRPGFRKPPLTPNGNHSQKPDHLCPKSSDYPSAVFAFVAVDLTNQLIHLDVHLPAGLSLWSRLGRLLCDVRPTSDRHLDTCILSLFKVVMGEDVTASTEKVLHPVMRGNGITMTSNLALGGIHFDDNGNHPLYWARYGRCFYGREEIYTLKAQAPATVRGNAKFRPMPLDGQSMPFNAGVQLDPSVSPSSSVDPNGTSRALIVTDNKGRASPIRLNLHLGDPSNQQVSAETLTNWSPDLLMPLDLTDLVPSYLRVLILPFWGGAPLESGKTVESTTKVLKWQAFSCQTPIQPLLVQSEVLTVYATLGDNDARHIAFLAREAAAGWPSGTERWRTELQPGDWTQSSRWHWSMEKRRVPWL